MINSIWDFQTLVMRRLLQWSMVSAVLGVVMSVLGRRYHRGIGSQFIGWAAVNFGIAFAGFTGTQNRLRQLGERAYAPDQLAKETRNLRRLLLINAGLDILYMLGGQTWMKRREASPFGCGMGFGILLQGAFLFVFDLYHARLLFGGKRIQQPRL